MSPNLLKLSHSSVIKAVLLYVAILNTSVLPSQAQTSAVTNNHSSERTYGEWVRFVTGAATNMKAPVVSSIPSKFDKALLTNKALDAKMLNEVLSSQGMAVDRFKNNLCFYQNSIPLPFFDKTKSLSTKDTAVYQSNIAKFLLSLTSQQVASFREGSALPVRSLNSIQIGNLSSAIAPLSQDLKSMSDGNIQCFLETSALVYKNGTQVDSINQSTVVPSSNAKSSYSSFKDTFSPQWDALSVSTKNVFFRNAVVPTSKVEVFRLDALMKKLDRLLENHDSHFVVTAQLQSSLVVVTENQWSAQDLLILALQASGAELRQVKDTFVVAPVTSRQILPRQNSPLQLEVVQLQMDWEKVAPVLREICKSPLSRETKIVPVNDVLQAHLIAYKNLSPAQKQWVITHGLEWSESGPPAELKNTEGVEVAFLPIIWFKVFSKQQFASAGTGWPSSYVWFAYRSAALAAG